MPTKKDAAYWRDYRERKRQAKESGSLPERFGAAIAAGDHDTALDVAKEGLLVVRAREADMVSLTPAEYALLKHSHDQCDALEARLREEVRLMDGVITDMRVELEAARIRVRFLEGTPPESRPERFDDVRTILPAPDGLDELFG